MIRRIAGVFLVLFVLTNYSLVSSLFSDTMQTSDGREIRGIVVEDYKDRIVMSTVDGEITTKKSDIKQLYYDSEAENLIKLAEQSKERGDMLKAFAYYDMALRADPNSKAAKDGVVFLQGYLFRKEQVKKEDEIRRREEFENFGAARIPEEKPAEEKIKEMTSTMREVIGITLTQEGGANIIESLRQNSPADEAGAIRGDAIIAVWGRLTGYMPLEDVLKLLLEKPSLEIKCTIERNVAVIPDPNRTILSSLKDMIGATFTMQFDGLTVSDVTEDSPAMSAGLMKGDIIVAIDGQSTRYMPLKKAISVMRSTKNSALLLKIRREILIWRRS